MCVPCSWQELGCIKQMQAPAIHLLGDGHLILYICNAGTAKDAGRWHTGQSGQAPITMALAQNSGYR